MSMKIIKSKTKGSGNSMDNIYSESMYRRTICGGTVGRGGNTIEVAVPTNSIPLNARIQHSSLRTAAKYNWETGTVTKEAISVLDNAREHINRLKLHSATSGWNEKDDKLVNVYGRPAGVQASPVVRVRKKKKQRK